MLALAIIATVLVIETIIFVPGFIMGYDLLDTLKVAGFIHLAFIILIGVSIGLTFLWMAAV